MAFDKGLGKASLQARRAAGLSSGVSASTSRFMEHFTISRMHSDILELRERVERLVAIIATGQPVDPNEL
eukprot:2482843-Karenia_brevis.AAC.1